MNESIDQAAGSFRPLGRPSQTAGVIDLLVLPTVTARRLDASGMKPTDQSRYSFAKCGLGAYLRESRSAKAGEPKNCTTLNLIKGERLIASATASCRSSLTAVDGLFGVVGNTILAHYEGLCTVTHTTTIGRDCRAARWRPEIRLVAQRPFSGERPLSHRI